MLIAILIICILSLIVFIIGLRETSDRIAHLEVTLDKVKKKTDTIGTEEGLTYGGNPIPWVMVFCF